MATPMSPRARRVILTSFIPPRPEVVFVPTTPQLGRSLESWPAHRSVRRRPLRARIIATSIVAIGFVTGIASVDFFSSSFAFAATNSTPITVSLLPGAKSQTISTPSGDAFYTLDVPPGTTPTEFVAELLVRGPVTGGIATVTTPTTAYPINLTAIGGVSKIVAPLSSKDVTDGQVAIQLHVDLTVAPTQLNASGCVPPPAVVAQVEQAVGVFAGSLVTPSNPADFWPTTLQRATVWVPSLRGLTRSGQQAAAQATLQVAALVAQQYGQQTLLSFRTGAPPPHAISPVSRDVEIEVTRSGPSSQLRIDDAGSAPVLVIAGRGGGLVAAARASARDSLALATARAASGVRSSAFRLSPSQVTVTPSGTREITLAQLGGLTSLEGVGTTTITDSLPQAQFGSPISSLQVRVRASYTPPPAGGQATFSVLVNGYIIGSQALGSSGQLGMNASVPQSILSRQQSVAFRLDYTPPGGVCHTGLLPVQVTINPSSGFLAAPGQTLVPGFLRAPQDVATNLPVDLVSFDDATLLDGCRLVAALSQILPSAPNVELVSTSALVPGSRPVVIVGASPALAQRLGAPLQLAPFRSIAEEGNAVGFEVRQPFAAIEAFSDHERDVVLLGAFADPELLTTLTREILQAPNGWFSLGTGELAVTTADGRLRIVRAAALLPQLVGSNTTSGPGIPRWLILALVAIGALVALRLTWLAVRMARLKRRARRATTAAHELSGRDDTVESSAGPGGPARSEAEPARNSADKTPHPLDET